MSDATLMVPTAFSDISQLAEGLTGRVESDRLMLYGPEPYEPGTTVHFALTLHDGGVAFEGTGRAIHSVDGGAERPEVARFDIILDSLEFAGSGQVVYDRILLELHGEEPYEGEAHQEVSAGDYTLDEGEDGLAVDDSASDPYGQLAEAADIEVEEGTEVVATGDGFEEEDIPITETADADDVAEPVVHAAQVDDEWPASPPDETFGGADSVDVDPAADASPPELYGEPSESDVESVSPDDPAGFDSVPPSSASYGEITDEVGVETSLYADESARASAVDEAPPMPPAPHGFDVQLRVSAESVLNRPGIDPSWQPVLTEVPSNRPASGYFQFSGGLPSPADPPRPDLDADYRVGPAPRPGEAPAHAEAADSESAEGSSPLYVPASNGHSGSPSGEPPAFADDEASVEDVESARDTDAPNPYDPDDVSVDVGSFPPPPDVDMEASFEDVARDVDDAAWLDPDRTER